MAHISYNKAWESEFDGIVCKNDELKDLDIDQLKLQVNDSYTKDENNNNF